MSKIKRSIVVLTLFGIVPFAISCSKVEKKPEVFIKIGAQSITYYEFQRDFNEYIYDLKQEFLKEYIHNRLIEMKGAELGITLDKDKILEYSKFLEKNVIDAPLDQYLKRIGLTMDQWQEKIKKDLVREKVIQQEVYDKIKVTDNEIETYYQKNKADFFSPRKYHIYQILTDSYEEAKTIKKKLKTTKYFTSLAKKYSKSPEARVGGDIGILPLEDLPSPAQDELQCLGTKKVSNIISSGLGYHIYMIKEIIPAGYKPLAEVKEKIAKTLLKAKREEALKKWLVKLEEETDIEVNSWDYYGL